MHPKLSMYLQRDRINGKNIAEIVSKMAGAFLGYRKTQISLIKETVNQLNKAMEFRTDGLIVIIEDEKIGMRKLIARFPKFTSKLTSMINIPVFLPSMSLLTLQKCTQEKWIYY